MASNLAKIIADFRTSLATKLTVGGTTATLQNATDDDGVALPSGTYYFTIDGDNTKKEHIKCTLSGSSLTSIESVSRQGSLTTGAVREHRIGASVTITNFAHILELNNLLDGTTDLDAGTPLQYDGAPSLTPASNELATVAYVDAISVSGAADATTTTKGITKMSVAPVSATDPIAVGDNDPRVPTQAENDDLGTMSGASAGSVFYSDGTDVQELGVGSAGQVLKVNSGATAPEWGDFGAISIQTGGETINGATTPVAGFRDSDGEWYACDANDNTRYRFHGFIVSNTTNGNSATVQMSGIVPGFTGLTAGSKYYVQDDKTLGTTAGTHVILVGIAISPTQMLIHKGMQTASGNVYLSPAISSSASSDITIGFRPTKIHFYCYGGNGTYQNCYSAGVWVPDGSKGSHWHSEGAVLHGGGFGGSIVGYLLTSYGAIITITISNVTESGFRVTSARNSDTDSIDSNIYWIAEGECI